MNIYAGREFGWGWQDHIDHKFLGGDDMKAPPGERILAPVAGRMSRTEHGVSITEPDGWKTECIELASTVHGSSVSVGDPIGIAGVKWPHWHSINPQGARVPARFLHQTPTPKPLGDDMKYIYKEEGGVAWAIIDSNLAAGFLQTTNVTEAEKYARVCPTPAALVSAATFAASITAATWYKTQCPAVSTVAPVFDYAAMAKAVNDDAAERLKS